MHTTLMCVHHFVCACVCTCMHVHVGICMYVIIMAGMPVFTWLATSSRKGADGLLLLLPHEDNVLNKFRILK